VALGRLCLLLRGHARQLRSCSLAGDGYPPGWPANGGPAPEPAGGVTALPGGSWRLMRLWRIGVCLAVLAVAGCSSGPLIPPHTAALLRGSRASAELDVVSGATTITVGTASLGSQLLRVWTPVDSGIRPD